MNRLSTLVLYAAALGGMSGGEAARAISDEQAARLQGLMDMDFEKLQEVEIKLDDVFNVFDGLIKRQQVKVASGLAQDASLAPASTTVITAQDIEASGARTLDEALEGVPGLHVARNYFYYAPIYTLRGIYSEFNPQVLIMVNGVPMKDLHAGNPGSRWVGMPVYNIQRIEVLRGPGSAVYGADALAGTINIITKTGGDINGTEVGGRGGSFDSYEGWALHGERGKNYEVAAAFHYGEEVGHNEPILQDHQTALDRVFKTNISHAPNEPQLQRDNLDARLDASLQDESGATWRANASYQGWRDTGSGAGPAEAIDTNGDSDYALSEIVLGWQQPRLTENWDVSAELAYTHHYYFHEGIQVFPPGAQGGRFPIGYNADSGIRENDTRLNLTGLYKGFANQVWRMGMGYFYGDQYEVRQKTNWLYPPQNPPVPLGTELVDISDTQFTFQQEEMRQNINAFLQDSWAFAQNWELTAGGRYDWYSDFGDTFNLRGALVWRTSPDLIAKLMYGEAFRAPSFQELYNAYNPLALGNPDLSPETIQTLETAFDYRASENLHLTLNLYAFTWKDAILFQTVPGRDTRVAANASGDRDGRGLELEARWKMTPRSSLLFNYALQRVEEENGQDIGGYPQQDGYARVDWMVYPNWYVDAQANYIGERERQAGDPRPALDGYVTLDLALRYKNIHGGNWNLALGLRNALDEELYEPSPGPDNRGVIRTPYDLPQAGRGWFAEVRYAFR